MSDMGDTPEKAEHVEIVESPVERTMKQFYPLDGVLPIQVAEKVLPTNTVRNRPVGRSPEEQAISNLFKDPRITLEQREKISTAILNGNFEFVQKAINQSNSRKPRLIPKDSEKLRVAELTVKRHQLPKPDFLQVITQSAPIPAISGREVRAQRIRAQHHMGSPPRRAPEIPSRSETFYHTQIQQSHQQQQLQQQQHQKGFEDSDISGAFEGMNVQHPQSHQQHRSLKDVQNQLVAQHVKRRMEKMKEEAKLKAAHAQRLRELEDATAEKKREVKKRLQEVRKSLRKHLVDNKDPQLGTIMRLVDESLIYHFMEKYSGFSMSAQAILSLIGNSLGTNLINPDIPTDDTPYGTAPTTADSADSSGYNFDIGNTTRNNTANTTSSRITIPVVEFDDSRHNTPAAGVPPSRGVSPGDQLRNNTSSRGRNRALLDSEPVPASIRRSARQCSRITNDREFVSTGTRTHPTSTSSTGAEDPVTGIAPRRYQAERSLSPDSKAAWGGGFRVVAPKPDDSHSPLRPVALTGVRPSSLPSQSHSRSISPSLQQQSRSQLKSAGHGASTDTYPSKESLVIFGSENLRLAARAMGFTTTTGEPITDEMVSELLDDPEGDNKSMFSQHSQQSHHSHHSLDSYHTTVPASAIAAIHEQLIEENMLPSMQPEKVLSDSQIADLASHKKSFNEIMNEISKSDRMRSTSHEYGYEHDHHEHDHDHLRTAHPTLSMYNSSSATGMRPSTTGGMPLSDSMPPSPRGAVDAVSVATIGVSSLVSGMMSAATPGKALFVQPLHETAAVPPAPKTFTTLYGSVYTSRDKERFKNLSALEVERGEERFGLQPSASGPHIGMPMSRPYEGSPGKTKLTPITLTHPPRAIKTKPGNKDEFGNIIPESPYKSYTEESSVLNTGIPSGAGYMLWRPRYRVSKDGRYRAGQNHTRVRNSLKEGPTKRPFVSSA